MCSAFDRELLSAYRAVKHFRHFVEGKSFTLYTDHKPLIATLSSSAERFPRQSRHFSYIAEFTSVIQFIRGKHNVVTDALSRINSAMMPIINYQQLAVDQVASAKTDAYRTAITSLVLQDVPY